jgi:hypothetical protein
MPPKSTPRALYDRAQAAPKVRLSVVVTDTGARIEDEHGTPYAFLPFTADRPRDVAVTEARLLVDLRHNVQGLTGALLRELSKPAPGAC